MDKIPDQVKIDAGLTPPGVWQVYTYMDVIWSLTKSIVSDVTIEQKGLSFLFIRFITNKNYNKRDNY